MSLRKWDESVRVSRQGAYGKPYDVLGIDTVLEVVGGLQLPVLHVVPFHPHEGGIGIRL